MEFVKGWRMTRRNTWLLILVGVALSSTIVFALSNDKSKSRIVHTKYSPLQGITLTDLNVDVFLGIPYAIPPINSLRYMPPVTPVITKKLRAATEYAPVCPQRLPDISNRSEALMTIPRRRLIFLERTLPLLANQSEDCLYLNIFVPKTITSPRETLATIVYVHGDSYEWGSGNIYDGSAVASYGNVIFITFNYRLGILGFLKTGTKSNTQGNYGLMDIVAVLQWIRENTAAFGGDPENLTLMGHGRGAALANFIAASPIARGLIQRVILISGSGHSSWAIQRDPIMVKKKVAEKTGCHGNLLEDDMAPCLRLMELKELMVIDLEQPLFMPGFAPFIDGTVLVSSLTDYLDLPDLLTLSKAKKGRGYELVDFPKVDLLVGFTSFESYLDFSAQDLEFGLVDDRLNRMLRTFVRNNYLFHLNELFTAMKVEYMDWRKPPGAPFTMRDTTMNVLSDAETVAPLLKALYLHNIIGGNSYAFHFQYSFGGIEYTRKEGSSYNEDLPFEFGLPLTQKHYYGIMYNSTDVLMSKLMIHYIASFARYGNPNGFVQNRLDSNFTRDSEFDVPYWRPFDYLNQDYMEIGKTCVVKNHYRGHKMSIWLNLFPQLHRPGPDESVQHHHLRIPSTGKPFDGKVRPALNSKPHVPEWKEENTSAPTTMATVMTTIWTSLTAGCNSSSVDPTESLSEADRKNETLIRLLAEQRAKEDYRVSLIETMVVGSIMVALNLTVFFTIMRQRNKNIEIAEQVEAIKNVTVTLYEHEECTADSCVPQKKFVKLGNLEPGSKQASGESTSINIEDIPMREFSTTIQIEQPTRTANVASGSDSPIGTIVPPIEFQDDKSDSIQEFDEPIPEPPPPPKSKPPSRLGGILRSAVQVHKPTQKRVQIQEMTV